LLIHRHTLISEDILEKEFLCNISQCKGACCSEGDYGAPLAAGETAQIQDNLEAIKPFMAEAALEKLHKEGFYEQDPEDETVTKCISHKDCIFAVFENGAYACAIEKAHHAGASTFHKPISCHLYPIRVSQVGEFTALNYDKWSICAPACQLGEQLKVPVYVFLKNALIRQFGQEWYDELDEIGKAYRAGNSSFSSRKETF